MPDEYDVIIIGGGASGENVAGRTAPGGLSTLIIESELVGGECSYWACIPSKTLLRPGEALAAARRVPGARPAVTGNVDVERTLRSRDWMVGDWDDKGQADWVASVGADLLRGHARLAGPKRVEVETGEGHRTLSARRAVVLAVGSTPVVPPVRGLDRIRPWNSRDATSAKKAPKSLVVLGSGPVGLEMAQAYRWLGSDVTLVDRGSPDSQDRFEPFAVQEVYEALRDSGVRVLTDASVESVAPSPQGVTAVLGDGTKLEAAELLLAVGRRPATDDVGLETVGLSPGEAVEVDDHLCARGVEGGWLYAVGDCNGRALLTHQGKYQARVAGDHILGRSVSAWGEDKGFPSVTFTDPQIAAVGLTERRARQTGANVRAVQLGWAVAAASLAGENTRGGAKFVVDEDKRVLLGATFVGPGAGELLHAATIAVTAQVPLDTLWHATPSFPTFSEIWLRFLEAYGL